MQKPSLQVNKLIVLNIGGAFLSLLFIILQAQFFGASREIEVYFISLSLVHVILGLLQADQIGTLFLPIYHKLQNTHSHKTGFQAFCIVINWVLLIAIPLIALALLFSGWFINSGILGYEQSSRALLAQVFLIMLPTALFQLLNFTIEVFHAANQHYGRSEAMIALSTALSVLSLILFFDDLGIWAMVLGWWLGCVVRFLINIYFLAQMGFRYHLVLSSGEFNHKAFFSQVFSSYIYSGSYQLYQLTFLSLATFLSPGVFAVYKYIENIFTRMQHVITHPVNTVFYTNFSRALQETTTDLKSILRWSLKRGLLLTTTLFILLFSFKEDLVGSLWPRNIGEDNILLGAELLLFFSITLIPFGISSLFQKMSLALGHAKKVYTYLSVVQLINAAYAIGALRYFDITGLKSVIIVTSLTSGVAMWHLVFKTHGNPFQKSDFKNIIKAIAVVAILLTLGIVVNTKLDVPFTFEIERINSFLRFATKSTVLSLILGVVYVWVMKKNKSTLL